MKRKILPFCMIALALSACASKPPKCGDSDASGLVEQIITNELDKLKANLVAMHPANAKIEYSVTLKDIRTVAKDDATGNYSCAGTINVDSTNFLFKKNVDITYTTEITEDSNAPYVTVYGFR